MILRPRHLAALRQPVFSFTSTRSFFSLPNIPSPFSGNSPEQSYQERKTLPYSQQELYTIVANVDSYRYFIPFCTASRVLAPVPPEAGESGEVVRAELGVGFMGFQESYVSRVQRRPYSSVIATASSETPLFKSLVTTYTFLPVSERTTEVAIDLRYAFANPLYAQVSGAFFGKVSGMMVQAFEDRARKVYGRR